MQLISAPPRDLDYVKTHASIVINSRIPRIRHNIALPLFLPVLRLASYGDTNKVFFKRKSRFLNTKHIWIFWIFV